MGYNYSEIKLITSSFPRMTSLPGSVMPVSGLPVSPSVARQAALFGKQVSIGPSGLVNSLLPPHYPMPDPKDSPPLNLGRAVAHLTRHPIKDKKGRSKRREIRALRAGSLLR